LGAGAALGALATVIASLILDLKYVGPWFHTITASTSSQYWSPLLTFLYFQGFPFVIALVVVTSVIGAIFSRGGR
jgi:hypothetical protein